MDIKEYISDKRRIIDKALDGYLPSSMSKPQTIHTAMRYAVFPGGKRLRPILTLASFEACGGRDSLIMPIACAIELIHIYTIIHDDLPCMDNDDYRRGRLSCHRKFGEAIALLSGDALLTLGFQLLSESGDVAIIKEVSKAIGSCGTIGGQALDIESQRVKEPKSQRGRVVEGRCARDLEYIISHKTGCLFEIAVKVGGMFKGVDKKRLDGLSNFGRLIGWTFQLIDDLIDKEGYAEIYGQDYVRSNAIDISVRAKNHLNVFGKKADRLLEIADLIIS